MDTPLTLDRTYLGIDPGSKGALGMIQSKATGHKISTFDVPMIRSTKKGVKDSYDIAGMVKLLEDAKATGPCQAFIEDVHAMPGQGVTSMFNFGKGFGIWLGILAALKIPYTLVSPVRWKKAMLADMRQDKAASRLRAQQLWPEATEQFSLVKHDGRAEALLLAEYGSRLVSLYVESTKPLAQAS
jgi:crossover junction endodeoxyribonuclease RuvC